MASFQWPYDGNTVHIAGSWNQWSERIPLSRDPKDPKAVFHTTIDLKPGFEYEYKFIIDGRRWCYDILKPTRADERGNRNNVIQVGRGQSAPPKGKEQHQHAAPAKEEVTHPKAKEQPAEQQKGGNKKERQQQQQQQQQQKQKKKQEQKEGGKEEEEEEKKERVSAAKAAEKVISTVKSYNAPWFVTDVDVEDNLDDVIAIADLFSKELPDSACLFLSGGQQTFIIVALVPESKASDANAIELINSALSVIANPPKPQGSNTLAHAIVKADPEKNIFPLKLKDLTRGPIFALLKKRGLVKDEDDDDEMPAFDF